MNQKLYAEQVCDDDCLPRILRWLKRTGRRTMAPCLATMITMFTFSIQAQIYNVLVTFTNGLVPDGGLVSSGSTLYGRSLNLSSNLMQVFSMNSDGTGYTNLCSISGEDSPAVSPLILSGGTLYGAIQNGYGIIYSVNTDGTDLKYLYRLDALPEGMILSGNILCGLIDGGCFFRINTDGTDYTNLYMSTSDAPLTAGGDLLYGTVADGGTNGTGAIFAANINGAYLTNLYNFPALNSSGESNNGSSPGSQLILSGGTLFGYTTSGGFYGQGTLFSIETNGTHFRSIYSFTTESGLPNNLVLSGSTLYGTAGASIFAVNTNGAYFTNLYNFPEYSTQFILNGMIIVGNTLYGTTVNYPETSPGYIFSLTLTFPPPPLTYVTSNNHLFLRWSNPVFSLQSAPSANGPWTTIPGATSAFIANVVGQQQYFRLAGPGSP